MIPIASGQANVMRVFLMAAGYHAHALQTLSYAIPGQSTNAWVDAREHSRNEQLRNSADLITMLRATALLITAHGQMLRHVHLVTGVMQVQKVVFLILTV